MLAHWAWWIAAAVLVGAELVTGTFYLLAVGLAAAAGGIAAWLGAAVSDPIHRCGGVRRSY
jgi:membrane protein implicated in regulation of membrane protease activity